MSRDIPQSQLAALSCMMVRAKATMMPVASQAGEIRSSLSCSFLVSHGWVLLYSSSGLQIGGPAQGTKLEDLHVGLRYAHSLRGLVHR